MDLRYYNRDKYTFIDVSVSPVYSYEGGKDRFGIKTCKIP